MALTCQTCGRWFGPEPNSSEFLMLEEFEAAKDFYWEIVNDHPCRPVCGQPLQVREGCPFTCGDGGFGNGGCSYFAGSEWCCMMAGGELFHASRGLAEVREEEDSDQVWGEVLHWLDVIGF